jgi:hypothetical protein
MVGLTLACPASVLALVIAAPLEASWTLPTLVPPALGTSAGVLLAVLILVLLRTHPWDEDDRSLAGDRDARRLRELRPHREPPNAVG